ncbi:3-hydroxyacyl-CoA dehydrogenase family protein [Janibacter limosus]|jgi:3-hydroxybutyryl-CoA dehydrogenase|uniref:3-hydroxyacyl-CoA dehydrogenase family protein n=1 Tax=Janibacter limosus TaxID=53458 RepID=A0A4P6MV49_9MICO|nr:3-hydroxyacyl-CoA dehydrogenase family protein [Janibacter limosus]QBF46782.1 3-hydroxyacyl-CoA dehydrogenase family protein [Janibacter limosus]
MTDGNIPTRTGVVGGGQMGAGIVHGLLLAGSSVVLLERDEAAATAARERVQRSCDKSVERGKIADAAEPMGRLTTTTEAADLADCGLVVEAVPEDEQLKRDTLQRVEAVIADDAALATNTSSISLDALATSLRHPERLLGLHFFNPVPASKLVEIVIATATDETWRERAVEWVSEGLGKTPVVVADSPGFASSRLGVAIGLEAIRMLEAGVASAEDIDAAMSLGYGHPMGPLRLTDLVGLDVRLGIARYLERELGPRFAPPQLLVDLVEQGHHGRKTGRGFYDWNDAKEKTA